MEDTGLILTSCPPSPRACTWLPRRDRKKAVAVGFANPPWILRRSAKKLRTHFPTLEAIRPTEISRGNFLSRPFSLVVTAKNGLASRIVSNVRAVGENPSAQLITTQGLRSLRVPGRQSVIPMGLSDVLSRGWVCVHRFKIAWSAFSVSLNRRYLAVVLKSDDPCANASATVIRQCPLPS